MELPSLEPAPVGTEHAGGFRDLFENQCPWRHFQHGLTGPMVLPHKSMATTARGILDSADKPTSPASSRRPAGASWIKRLTRKTIRCSQSMQMHDIVIGSFVNRYKFGVVV
jgi:hypothetical protein